MLKVVGPAGRPRACPGSCSTARPGGPGRTGWLSPGARRGRRRAVGRVRAARAAPAGPGQGPARVRASRPRVGGGGLGTGRAAAGPPDRRPRVRARPTRGLVGLPRAGAGSGPAPTGQDLTGVIRQLLEGAEQLPAARGREDSVQLGRGGRLARGDCSPQRARRANSRRPFDRTRLRASFATICNSHGRRGSFARKRSSARHALTKPSSSSVLGRRLHCG